MNSLEARLNPAGERDLVWDPQFDGIGRTSPDEVAMLTSIYNASSLEARLRAIRGYALPGEDIETGMEYMTFTRPGDSKDSLIVHGHPFTNDMSDNMLLRGDYLYRAFEALGIRDQEGRTLPVMSLAKPGPNSRMRFATDRRTNSAILKHEINEGNFAPAGELQLEVVRRAHPRAGRIARVGFSLDACIIPTEVALAPSMSLDMTHAVMGDPVNVVDRSERSPFKLFVRDFAPEGKMLKENVARAGIEAFVEVHEGDSDIAFVKNVLKHAKTNKALGFGMATEGFAGSLAEAAKTDTLLTVGATNEGKVSPLDDVMNAVAYARLFVNPNVHMVILGAKGKETHSVGDQLDVLSTFYGYGLSRSR